MKALARSVINLIESRSSNVAASSAGEENTAAQVSPDDQTANRTSFFDRYVKHYLIATVIIILTSLIKVFIDTVTQIESPYLLFACAILIAAWRGGLGPGIYSTFVAVLTVNYFFIHSEAHIFEHGFGQNLLFLIFAGQGVLIAALCASRLRNEQLLEQSRNYLESRVAHRTTQLGQANKELKQEIRERSLLQEDLRQARDVALESARLKSEFLANMSHEIRTPMNGVIGMTGLLLETSLNHEQTRFAQTIRSSGESLLTIINDILDFSKVEAGKLDLEMSDFNLRDDIEGLVEMFSHRVQTQSNELAALIYADVPLLVRGDAGRIRQVLTNLIGNAIKFTKQGDIVVRIKKMRETSSHVELKFSITDTGPGISEEVQSKLFQPFTQSDASTTRRFGGTGLGLSISKKLVEIMNGEIGLESEIGKGSTFWFTITLEKSVAGSATMPELSASAPVHQELDGRRVLIVDDNQVNREILTYQTRSWKMDVQESDNSREAVALINSVVPPIDIVILDLQMPDIDGLETARWIASQNTHHGHRKPPAVIMLSSTGFNLDAQTQRNLGIKAFLTKPYRQDDLLRAVYQALEPGQTGIFADSDIRITAPVETDDFSRLSQTKEKAKRILIVEDNPVNQLVAQTQLEKSGYYADLAANGLEALQALATIPYDLVLMDCQMPEMDGYEAAREIRAQDWNAAQIPIIALTAHATAGEREKCLYSGMDDYISKPVEKENLLRAIRQWVSKTRNEAGAVPAAATFVPAIAVTNERDRAPNDFAIDEAGVVGLTKDDSISAVNLATLNEVTDHCAEMRREVIEAYLVQTRKQLDEMEEAIDLGDAAKLFGIAHKTLGGSALCGMAAIVEPLRKLEQLGRAEEMEETGLVFGQAQKAFAAIDEECRRILEN